MHNFTNLIRTYFPFNLFNQFLKDLSPSECKDHRLHPSCLDFGLTAQSQGQGQCGQWVALSYYWATTSRWVVGAVWIPLLLHSFVFYLHGMSSANLHKRGHVEVLVLAIKKQCTAMKYLRLEGKWHVLKIPGRKVATHCPYRENKQCPLCGGCCRAGDSARQVQGLPTRMGDLEWKPFLQNIPQEQRVSFKPFQTRVHGFLRGHLCSPYGRGLTDVGLAVKELSFQQHYGQSSLQRLIPVWHLELKINF